ncbi:MAG TPA: NAD(P)/FAD-dependent oxidoreductase [Solirubrobacteraceae bacterium]
MGKRVELDAIVVGGGHNGLVAAALLARAGLAVTVLERCARVGGAAVSTRPFAGVDARLSRYSYLVSLFPASLLRTLEVTLELRPRRIAAYVPDGDQGLLVSEDADCSRRSMTAIAGDPHEFEAWQSFHRMLGKLAQRVFPTLTEPLRSREELRALVGDDVIWRALFEEPIAAVIERTFSSDLVRGMVLTDALTGTFASAHDSDLRQNRCFLYHVIGNGTGRWDVPVGGMGALSDALAACCLKAGADLRTGVEATSIETDGVTAEVHCADGQRFAARNVLAGVAPAVLSRLLGDESTAPAPEGSQLKINMLLSRLPNLRDPGVSPSEAFTGTFRVNEGYAALGRAFDQAGAGRIPTVPPSEVYCHSLTDSTILSPELRAAGAQTLTVFAMHMPARLFAGGAAGAKEKAVTAALRSIDSVLAERIEDCLWLAEDGAPCIEALTPSEIEDQLGMPGGHIFHRDLAWPYAESDEELGQWGVETDHPNVWICGAGARRGGGVSGIPGHNAARAVLAARAHSAGAASPGAVD